MTMGFGSYKMPNFLTFRTIFTFEKYTLKYSVAKGYDD
jgi:hypothetical protein